MRARMSTSATCALPAVCAAKLRARLATQGQLVAAVSRPFELAAAASPPAPATISTAAVIVNGPRAVTFTPRSAAAAERAWFACNQRIVALAVRVAAALADGLAIPLLPPLLSPSLSRRPTIPSCLFCPLACMSVLPSGENTGRGGGEGEEGQMHNQAVPVRTVRPTRRSVHERAPAVVRVKDRGLELRRRIKRAPRLVIATRINKVTLVLTTIPIIHP